MSEQPAVASHRNVLFFHMSGQPADTSFKKSPFCIMSGDKKLNNKYIKVFHANVWTLGQRVRTRFTKSLLSDTCLDKCWQIQTPPPKNLFLTCFRISKAYLNGLLGSVFLRILIENSIVLRESLLGINVYMYLS
jgi:hypothetical protein